MGERAFALSAHEVRIGTAGWSLPRESQHHFPPGASHLVRYAALLPAAEVNSTFHRSHRTTTYERWAASVPPDFRFSVKLPRAITHDRRLASTAALVDAFLDEIAPLAPRVGCLLVQLPPSLEYPARTARAFFERLRRRFDAGIAVEPRHESWFAASAERMLAANQVARVAADPPRAPNGMEPGGWGGLAYFRLHGSPRVYYSSYDAAFLARLARRIDALRRARVPCWCIFDNTTLGAGTGNALALRALLE